jgi:hypothetical protein
VLRQQPVLRLGERRTDAAQEGFELGLDRGPVAARDGVAQPVGRHVTRHLQQRLPGQRALAEAGGQQAAAAPEDALLDAPDALVQREDRLEGVALGGVEQPGDLAGSRSLCELRVEG